jgi:glutaredoxin 3
MRVEIYTKNWCVYCYRAKAMLEAQGIEYVEYDVTRDPDSEAEMWERSGARTVPQIFIDGMAMGGSDDLSALIREGRLQAMFER